MVLVVRNAGLSHASAIGGTGSAINKISSRTFQAFFFFFLPLLYRAIPILVLFEATSFVLFLCAQEKHRQYQVENIEIVTTLSTCVGETH